MKKDYFKPKTRVVAIRPCTFFAVSDPNLVVGDDNNPSDPNDPILSKGDRGGAWDTEW